MARRRIEMIEEYLMPNDEYHDYQYYDNHGVLVRCRDCVYFSPNVHDRGDDSRCVWWNRETRADDYCSSAERRCADDEMEDDHA